MFLSWSAYFHDTISGLFLGHFLKTLKENKLKEKTKTEAFYRKTQVRQYIGKNLKIRQLWSLTNIDKVCVYIIDFITDMKNPTKSLAKLKTYIWNLSVLVKHLEDLISGEKIQGFWRRKSQYLSKNTQGFCQNLDNSRQLWVGDNCRAKKKHG